MKDAIGQEIALGATVLWGGGKTQYAGFKKFTVVKITTKQVTLSNNVSIDPLNLVVIDKLL